MLCGGHLVSPAQLVGIEHFQQLLRTERDPGQRAMIAKLLDEARSQLRNSEMNHDEAQRDPRP